MRAYKQDKETSARHDDERRSGKKSERARQVEGGRARLKPSGTHTRARRTKHTSIKYSTALMMMIKKAGN